MEKAQILEALAPFSLSAESAKSATNRISSALEKEGTPAQLLSSVTQSLNALAGKVDEDSSDYGALMALVSVFTFSTAIAKAGTEKAKKPREKWYPADSAEGKAILSGEKPAKPKKSQAPATPAKAIDPDQVRALLEALLNAGK